MDKSEQNRQSPDPTEVTFQCNRQQVNTTFKETSSMSNGDKGRGENTARMGESLVQVGELTIILNSEDLTEKRTLHQVLKRLKGIQPCIYSCSR